MIATYTFERMHVLCRILVSSTRKPISYINLAKRFLQEHGEVQLSALGITVAPMVTVAEILKNRRLAVERKITTSLEVLSDDYRCVVCGAWHFPELPTIVSFKAILLVFRLCREASSLPQPSQIKEFVCCGDVLWHVRLTKTN